MSAALQSGLTSVVIVTADSGAIVGDCIKRVLESSAMVEIIIVDNASQDAQPTAEMAPLFADARLRLLRNEENIGFGPACNRGASLARGDALLFLNPDCLIDSGTIAGLRRLREQHPDAGLIGVRVEDANGAPEAAMRRRDPSLRRALMSISGLDRFADRNPLFEGIGMSPPTEALEAEAVDAVSGACLYLGRDAFDAVGGFDEDYFLHCEDLDLCRRMRDSGRRVLFAGGLRVRHEQGSSSRRRPRFVSRHKHRGMWRYFSRFDPAARVLPLRGLVWLGIWAHYY
ncbi:MAG: glycosyltransferase family 2 protein, partial [Dokdonella sp.]